MNTKTTRERKGVAEKPNERLSDRLRMYIKAYEQPPFGREVAGTIELLKETAKKLAEYENFEEQGKLLRLPCAVGDTVYTNISMRGWYFRKENRPYKAKVVFIGINRVDNYMNIDFGNGHMLQFKFLEIGRTVFLTKESALQKMNEMEME